MRATFLMPFLFSILLPLSAFSQVDSLEQEFERRHDEMLKLLKDLGPGFDIDEFFKDPSQGLTNEAFAGNTQQMTVKQKTLNNGNIEVTVIPKDDKTPLDIKLEGTQIKISSEKKVSNLIQSQSGKSQSLSISSSNYVVPIPYSYEAQTPVKGENGIVITLRPKQNKASIIPGPDDNMREKDSSTSTKVDTTL